MKNAFWLLSAALVLTLSGCQKEPPEIKVSSVSVTPATLSLVEGESQLLKAAVLPADASHPEVSWTSSNPQVATVSSGTVKAVKPGTATITATADGIKGSCTVTVTAKIISVTGIKLDTNSATLEEGGSLTLKATVSPEDASDKSVSWSSSATDVATVDKNGKVSAIKAGSAVITAKTTDGGKTATCEITVIAKVASISLDKTQATLAEGESVTLTATVLPENASDNSVTWSSSAPDVASVDANGKVTAIKKGSATITVTTNDGGKTATCEITVIAKVASVSLDKTQATLAEGESETLMATITPENANDKSVTWSSSATDVASVDANGKVTAIKKGSATITVTTNDGGKTATCEITVIAKVASVSLDKTTLTLKVGEAQTLVATVLPENANDKSISWSSSAPDVASVDATGKVTALKPGSADITVKTTDGGKTAVCAVTVQAAGGGIEDYSNGGNYGNNEF